MDPNTPQMPFTPVAPDQAPQTNTPAPKRKPFSRPPSKKQIIIAAAALLLLAIIAVFVTNTLRYRNSSGQNLTNLKPGDINGPYYEREGYPRKQIGSLIGDAMALSLQKNSRSVKAGGTAIFPACAILTQSDVRGAGLQTKASPQDQSGVQMIYVDGKGSAPIPYDKSMILNEANKCTYQLEGTPGQVNSVAISAYQAFQASAVAIREEVSIKYEQASPIPGVEGVQLFSLRSAQNGGRDTKANTTEYYIAKDTQVVLRIRLQYAGGDRQAKIESLVKTALANIDALAASPQGAPTPTYKDSPTYKQEYLRACSLLNDAALKTMGAKQAAAAVTENLSNSTGVARFDKQKDDSLYLYVQNSCQRDGAGAEDNASVQVTTYSFLNGKGAERQLAELKSRSKGSEAVSDVGDQALAASGVTGLGGELLFRQGRYVVVIEYSAPNQSPTATVNLREYGQTVKPLAEYISKQIKQ